MTSSTTITWWGSSGVEIAGPNRSLVVDPYLHPVEPRIDYICITHQDFDHCHEPTLHQLIDGPAFRHLFLPKSCTARTRLDSPVHDNATELEWVPAEKRTVLYPEITREPAASYPGPLRAEVDGFLIETADSSERPERYRSDSGVLWPDGTGPYVGGGEYPQLGYLITELTSGLTFYHPGDLHEAYDNLRLLRGRVDYMFFPSVKLEGVEITVVDAVRPRFIVPIHHRLDTPDFPIPLGITQADLTALDIFRGSPKSGTESEVYRREYEALIQAHWYPTPHPPLERIESLAGQFAELGSELLILEPANSFVVAQ